MGQSIWDVNQKLPDQLFWRLPIIMLFVIILSACGVVQDPGEPVSPTNTQSVGEESSQNKTLNVFAAISLTEALTELAGQFEAQNPGTDVILNFAGSQQLVAQLFEGAPADVFISANQAQMQAAMAADRVAGDQAQPFLGNDLILVYAKYNPGNLRRLKDLANPGVKLVLGKDVAPIGQYTLEFLEKASQAPDFGETFKDDVLKNVVSFEDDVRAVLAKVERGEADAGIVYRSDVSPQVAPDVGVREIPSLLNVNALYFITSIQDSANPELARNFIDFVLSSESQDIFNKYGFQPVQ